MKITVTENKSLLDIVYHLYSLTRIHVAYYSCKVNTVPNESEHFTYKLYMFDICVYLFEQLSLK